MHSKSDKIEIVINDKAVIEEPFPITSLKIGIKLDWKHQ